MDDAEAAKTAAEKASEVGRDDRARHAETPPAGPHAKPHLTNEAATPGAGALPDMAPKQAEVDGGVG